MPVKSGGTAPLPPLGFSIGIVGHRPDRLVDQHAIAARLGGLFTAISNAVASTASPGSHDGLMPLRLVSALAEGADRIAADVAIAQGLSLVAVLPFPAAVYEGDFADDASRLVFRELLEKVEANIILDGVVGARERAYDRAGLVLLDNVDLLVAVWDGGPGRGRGGTREVIEEAARRGIPVVTVSTDGVQVVIRSSGPQAVPMRFADVPHLPEDRLVEVVTALIALPADPAEEASWTRLTKTPAFGMAHIAYPLLLRLTGTSGGRTKAPDTPPLPDDELGAAFAWWDGAAVQAAQAFRSAVIVNFGLAALAVVLAAGSVLAGHWKWLFVAVEVVTILLLLGNTALGRRQNWQDRWLESREVSELLRVAAIRRRFAIGRSTSAGDDSRSGHYVAAFARAAPPPSIDLSDPLVAAEPAIAEVRQQADWNAQTAHRMHRAAHRIERFGEVLFTIVLVAAVLWLGLYFINPEAATALKYPLTALTAGLPAIATGSYGIRVIIDFEGIAERCQRIADGLRRLLDQLETAAPSAEDLQHFSRAASATMMADVAAWRLLAEGRRLTIPG